MSVLACLAAGADVLAGGDVPAAPAVLRVGVEIAAGAAAVGEPGRADADAASADLPPGADVAAASTVLGVGTHVAAGPAAAPPARWTRRAAGSAVGRVAAQRPAGAAAVGLRRRTADAAGAARRALQARGAAEFPAAFVDDFLQTAGIIGPGPPLAAAGCGARGVQA